MRPLGSTLLPCTCCYVVIGICRIFHNSEIVFFNFEVEGSPTVFHVTEGDNVFTVGRNGGFKVKGYTGERKE